MPYAVTCNKSEEAVETSKRKNAGTNDIRRGDPIRLSGTMNGVKYRFGVANPFNRRNPAPLDARHLPALRALLGFVNPDHLTKGFTISEVEFTRRCPAEHAWALLVDILICWVRTSTGGRTTTTVVSHFASVTFEENIDGSQKNVFVAFGEHVIPIIKGMLDAGAQTRQLEEAS